MKNDLKFKVLLEKQAEAYSEVYLAILKPFIEMVKEKDPVQYEVILKEMDDEIKMATKGKSLDEALKNIDEKIKVFKARLN